LRCKRGRLLGDATLCNACCAERFEKRHEIYLGIRDAVSQIVTQSMGFDREKEQAFLAAKKRAYFFFGDDIRDYLEQMWKDIVDVRAGDDAKPWLPDKTLLDRRYAALIVSLSSTQWAGRYSPSTCGFPKPYRHHSTAGWRT
jgi:hypothetical protein